MLDGIQAHAPQAVSRVVSQGMGNETMRGLVQCYSNDDWKHPR